MMNFIWAILIIVAIVYGILSGNGIAVAGSVIKGSETSIKLLITLAGSMAVWNGIMNIADNCGITGALSSLFYPVLKFLFPEYKNNKVVMNSISTNITANLIGIGNASTPAGLKAISAMYKGENYADKNMTTFVVMNTASIQLIPTTIATLRSSAGSNAPMEIVVCIWISSITALIVGISATKILCRKF